MSGMWIVSMGDFSACGHHLSPDRAFPCAAKMAAFPVRRSGGAPSEFRGFCGFRRNLAMPSNHDETARQHITASSRAILRLSHGLARPLMKNGESPASRVLTKQQKLWYDPRRLKQPLRKRLLRKREFQEEEVNEICRPRG